jgi:hypothetical protein
MNTRRIARAIVYMLVGLTGDILGIAACFIAVALFTVLLGLVLPFAVALVIALPSVCVCFGYHRALRIERARERGEHR